MPSPENSKYAEFVELYSAHARRIYGFVLTLVPNWADADDVFQEASKVLWEKFGQFTPGTEFFAWSCRIVHYQALYYRQRQQRSKLQFTPEFLDAVSAQTLSDADRLESQHRILADCLAKLSASSRELVELRYQSGATTQSVAQELGRSVDAIYKALNRAQRTLIECVERALKREEAAS